MKINFTENPEIITLTESTFIFVEKIGPFMQTAPSAWEEMWSLTGPQVQNLAIEKMAGLSRIDESKSDDSKFIYQAGLFLKTNPPQSVLSPQLQSRVFMGGKFAKFLLTGGYHQLQFAYPQAFDSVAKNRFQIRPDFCLEIYLNTPQDTPEENLKTEILIPVV